LVTLCVSCVTKPLGERAVEQLASQLDGGWSRSTADAIFAQGTNVLPQLWKLQETQGYPKHVYERAEQLAELLCEDDALRLVGQERLFIGTLPVAHTNLAEAVALAVPLLLPTTQARHWEVESIRITEDGTRALVRCRAALDSLNGTGWALVFVKRQKAWVLALIRLEWIS
jgi:hypothetical protein